MSYREIPKIKPEPKREILEVEYNLLMGLLARIHRDGGHHTERVGLVRSVADADAAVIRWPAADQPAPTETSADALLRNLELLIKTPDSEAIIRRGLNDEIMVYRVGPGAERDAAELVSWCTWSLPEALGQLAKPTATETASDRLAILDSHICELLELLKYDGRENLVADVALTGESLDRYQERLAHTLANPPGPRHARESTADWPVEEPGVLHRLRVAKGATQKPEGE